MKPISLKKIQHYTGGRLSVVTDETIEAISTSSREIPEGCLFVAIKGERFDGHDFIGDAVANGARAVVSHGGDLDIPVPAVYVEDTRQALLDIAAGYRGNFSFPVVGLTGSVGKTTTKEMIWSVLSQRWHTLKTEGNFNNQIGLPKTIFRFSDEYQCAVLEMGMSDFGEIASMTAAARPDVAVITNIGVSHIEFLGSREGICRAKLELLEGLSPNGTAVLNGDEPLLFDKKGEIPFRTLYFGIENPACDIRAERIALRDGCVRFEIVCRDSRFPCVLRTPGRHNVMNALAAAGAALALGLTPEEISAGLARYETVGMRQRLYEKNGFFVYEDCYNASPDSMLAALSVLSELAVPGRKIGVLGGMMELGAYRVQGHRSVGRKAAACCDALYLYGEGAEEYKEGALAGGMAEEAIFLCKSHDGLAAALQRDCRPGDALLFKGSRGMRMEVSLKLFLGEEVE